MVKPESAAKFILAFLCIQSSPFVYAHGQGLFVMYIGVPTAALAFIISAIIVRCAYKSVKLWQYAILSLLFFLLWIPVYTIATFIAADFLDSAGILSHRYSEEYVSAFILPLLLIFCAIFWFSIKRNRN